MHDKSRSIFCKVFIKSLGYWYFLRRYDIFAPEAYIQCFLSRIKRKTGTMEVIYYMRNYYPLTAAQKMHHNWIMDYGTQQVSGVSVVASVQAELDFGLLSELVIEELQTKAQEKNIEITLQKQDDLFMNGDQTLILRMMMNLITNAINYGKTNGHIHVILKVENDQIVGEVKDDGIGISEEHLDRIWERFYRIDKSRSRENGGTGLGLSMVRWIVNLHNGTIHVESIEGIGTSFIFRFPKI